MESTKKKENNNPWGVMNLEEFLFYCCPECNVKDKSRDEFVKHALNHHPDAKDQFSNLIFKLDPSEDFNDNIYDEGGIAANHTGFEESENDKIKQELSDTKMIVETNHRLKYDDDDEYYEEEISENLHEAYEKSQCLQCYNQFDSPFELKKHVAMVHEGKCKTKKRREKREKNFNNLIKDGFKCGSCDKTFKKFGQMIINHKFTVHGISQKNCELCGKTFQDIEELKHHVIKECPQKLLLGLNQNKCDICSKIYRNALQVKKHKRTVHEGIKDHSCEICGKNFTAINTLKEHIKTIHEGRKDFICPQCSKPFGLKKNLVVHVQTVHEGQRNHICETCGSAFSQQKRLSKHIRTVHEKRILHFCDLCSKGFSDSNGVKDHKARMHKLIKDQICQNCQKSYSARSDLMRHIRGSKPCLKLRQELL